MEVIPQLKLLMLIGTVSGDIKLSVGSDLVRSLGCNDLSAGRNFALLDRVIRKYANVFRT